MNHENLDREELMSQEQLRHALDRLGALVGRPTERRPDFVSRVVQQIATARIQSTVEFDRPEMTPKRSRFIGRWIAYSATGLAACALIALVLPPFTLAHPQAPSPQVSSLQVSSVVANQQMSGQRSSSTEMPIQQKVDVPPLPQVEPPPTVRRSTFSTVTEDVVLDQDVPVRKLLYREFERVELVDAQGNTECRMIVPTKAMLLAAKEAY